MNVTVQVIGAPEDVAAFLREIGGWKTGELPVASNAEVTADAEVAPDADQGPVWMEEKKDDESGFSEVPNPGAEAMESVPTESKEEPVSEPEISYAQLQHALKGWGVRYQQRHSDSDVYSARDALFKICEEIGGAEKGEGSKGIKKELYKAVYDFCLEDREL